MVEPPWPRPRSGMETGILVSMSDAGDNRDLLTTRISREEARLAEIELARGESEISRARELGKRYVKALWPRRIKRNQPEEVCRLQPQFASDPAPYSNLQPVLRVLELPKPPKGPEAAVKNANDGASQRRSYHPQTGTDKLCTDTR